MTLTMALAIAAVVVLCALALHAWWSTRSSAPKQAAPARAGAVADARLEPSLDVGTAAEGVAERVADPALALEARTVPQRRAARLDALVDAIAPLAVEAPVSGEAVLAHLPPTRRAGTKPFLVEALNAETGEWEQPVAGQRYGEFQAGVQLANRHGPLNEIEYSEFVHKVQAFADAVGALPDFPDMLDVVTRARELDAFAQAHDAQLVMRLRANSVAWSVGYLQQAAARHGMVPGAVPGRLVLPGEGDAVPPVLVLSFDAQAALAEDPNQSALREAALSLDVPQTPEAAEPFAAWQRVGRDLCDDLDATLVDEAGHPITLHAFSAIDQELRTLYRALEARDLAAGSAAARRLFS
ncbi:MAG: cell division protein FtsZ [Burkholderiaceae bacterium]|nr:cell division protein FtsZ [Burkholderiaceae bacterium]